MTIEEYATAQHLRPRFPQLALDGLTRMCYYLVVFLDAKPESSPCKGLQCIVLRYTHNSLYLQTPESVDLRLGRNETEPLHMSNH